MTERENTLRAFRFQKPERIPISFVINPASWAYYGVGALEDLMTTHRVLFPGFRKGSVDLEKIGFAPEARKGSKHKDEWGVVRETTVDGIMGVATEFPLDSWEKFAGFGPPDPDRTDGRSALMWSDVAKGVAGRKAEGRLIELGPHHGHTFILLQELRGYDNLIEDMHEEEPRLDGLVKMVEKFNMGLVKRYLALEPDIMLYPEDLGAEKGPMVTPKAFRRYLKPSYTRLMACAKEKGILVHMHSDGDIMVLVDDILECGVDVLNPQDLVNGIDNLRKHVKGRAAIMLDIDRQKVTVRGTPAEIDDLIREEVEKLGDPKGGLALQYGLYPATPLENVRAVMDALERYSWFYS